MASAPHIDRHADVVTTCSAWERAFVEVSLRPELFRDVAGIEAHETFGVAMCVLPGDISLRAYAIEAIGRVVAGQGLDVAGWRDVPVCAPGIDLHVAQLVMTSPDEVDEAVFERKLARVQVIVERELASMGLCDDARVISCSCRSIRYPVLDGATPSGASYPDLTGDLRKIERPFHAEADA